MTIIELRDILNRRIDDGQADELILHQYMLQRHVKAAGTLTPDDWFEFVRWAQDTYGDECDDLAQSMFDSWYAQEREEAA